jgi:hypothetical protein
MMISQVCRAHNPATGEIIDHHQAAAIGTDDTHTIQPGQAGDTAAVELVTVQFGAIGQ